ncbi:C4-dicarboxylate TRAP transporter substrate-binding protein [Desmospora activa]|uniref:Tripartite ATP-independent transporter DctP family solute receptor n=1 Tax=Desmospora activa DSM 45169 TaxID=1121389 RepID=A0A2T4ZBC5_9BACL|nr:C4-dicarboxylate TRAP transporter substrate-binding protein [Desmospora activa]PTM59176.1 tripartite ATP-independent transporter DctP family solute receptor [Desmospora activa DSM 45169]
MKQQHRCLFTAIILFVGVLVGCSPVSSTSHSPFTDETITVNIAYGNHPGEPVDQLAHKWKELAEERSEGRLQLNLYPSSQLGSEADVVEQAKLGSNVIILTGYDFLMNFAPDVGVMTAPYLVDDFDELFALTETDWFEEQRSQLQQQGLDIVTTNTIYGERHLMTTREVNTPEDLKGMKIRVPNNPMYIGTFRVLGASPTPLPLADMYTSLQQGVIDGAENPLPVLAGAKTNEVAKHLTLTGHTKIISPWVTGTPFIDSLPDELEKILRESGDDAGEYAKAIVVSEEKRVLKKFKEQGIQINEIDQEPFQQRAKGIYEEMDEWSPDLQQTIEALLADIRSDGDERGGNN